MHPHEPFPTIAPEPPRLPQRRSGRGPVVATVGGLALVVAGSVLAVQAIEQRNPSASPFEGTVQFIPRQGNGAPAYDGSGQATDASAEQSVGLVEISTVTDEGRAAGTGMVLTSDGEVVTNHHVVAGASSIEVTVVSTGETYAARYVGADEQADVAVLELEGAQGLDTVQLAGDAAEPGDEITSVGDANGDGGSLTASPGTVTATDQTITVQDDDGSAHQLSGLIQLDADIVPGDSGGAVLDNDGQVVGMNVAASSGRADITGFAIPIATVKEIVDSADLGSGSDGGSSSGTAYLGIGLSSDTTVASVAPGSAADDAGLAEGDTIVAIDGQRVSTADDVVAAIRSHDAGDRMEIVWFTADGYQDGATVTLGTAPLGQ